MRQDSPDQLIDVFKAAALSVTKLYKHSVASETRARQDGYQDCLEELLAFIDKEGTAVGDSRILKIKKWALDRRDGREAALTSESEDEIDKPESNPLADTANATVSCSPEPTARPQEDSPPIEVVTTTRSSSPHFVVPSQDFTFQSDHQYPNIATLDLSDTRTHGGTGHTQQRSSRNRGNRTTLRSNHLGRGAGAKRRMDFDDFFGGCLGGKDPFGNGGGKRSRHS